jgi:hypothetical protein
MTIINATHRFGNRRALNEQFKDRLNKVCGNTLEKLSGFAITDRDVTPIYNQRDMDCKAVEAYQAGTQYTAHHTLEWFNQCEKWLQEDNRSHDLKMLDALRQSWINVVLKGLE